MKNLNPAAGLLILFTLLLSCNSKTNSPSLKADTSKQISDTTQTTTDSSKNNPEKKKKGGEASLWSVNQKSSKISFTIKNFGKDVHGTLSGLKAKIHFDPNNLGGSNFEASVPISTINTGVTKRDKDLMHPKYFDGDKYPEITFHSDTVIKSANGFTVKGNLIIKGKSLKRDISFSFESQGNTAVFKSQFTLQRLDYGIGGTGPIMGKDVDVSLEINAEKQ